MAFTVTIAGSQTSVIGQSGSYTATASGAAVPGTVTYAWSVDNVVQSETTNIFNYTATAPTGNKIIKVVATNTPEAGEAETAEGTITVAVSNKTMTGVTGTLTTTTPNVKVGESYSATADVTGAPAGASYSYLWSTGETTKSVSKVADTQGTLNLTCTIKVDATDYDQLTLNPAAVSIVVSAADPVIPEECPLIYVHPLPVRNTAYIWCGWWVMDAIQKLTFEGKNWKTATEADTPYYCHLAVLAKMINDYPEVDVQESRNGRIIHRSALDAGIIYDYIY
ncbi:Hoc-like head decoration [Salmonella phage vB_SnwM_CGG4-1]|uniref:Highly immunogenic outer capsid protein n=1 Tax=Salmonella phage vB_SnwM_CGG4-1 TaxID=1815631 RepID=A0A1B0VW17_9CAUD|nr:Hoc-like head decoration [Salmonella phage vB_SnwM_CGG4-1]ANA49524.1 outer capsid protein Hoc II [Salmonella phage vB_SnwM_CGG4-1]